jgi:urease accessory protein
MLKQVIALAVVSFIPVLARAHVLPGDAAGFHHGFVHPMFGLDHILAMVAVGLWAAQLGGRALWAVPASFVGVMVTGALLGAKGVTVPFVETGIMVSVLFLGLLILASVRLPLWASMAVVGVFAIFHGHAHGAEMPVTMSGLESGIGFILATTILHASGLVLGGLARQPLLVRIPVLRVSGACIMLIGAALALS